MNPIVHPYFQITVMYNTPEPQRKAFCQRLAALKPRKYKTREAGETALNQMPKDLAAVCYVAQTLDIF